MNTARLDQRIESREERSSGAKLSSRRATSETKMLCQDSRSSRRDDMATKTKVKRTRKPKHVPAVREEYIDFKYINYSLLDGLREKFEKASQAVDAYQADMHLILSTMNIGESNVLAIDLKAGRVEYRTVRFVPAVEKK
jgi:hypothetical protein